MGKVHRSTACLPESEEKRGPQRTDKYTFHYYFICWDKIISSLWVTKHSWKTQSNNAWPLKPNVLIAYYITPSIAVFSRLGRVSNAVETDWEEAEAEVLKNLHISIGSFWRMEAMQAAESLQQQRWDHSGVAAGLVDGHSCSWRAGSGVLWLCSKQIQSGNCLPDWWVLLQFELLTICGFNILFAYWHGPLKFLKCFHKYDYNLSFYREGSQVSEIEMSCPNSQGWHMDAQGDRDSRFWILLYNTCRCPLQLNHMGEKNLENEQFGVCSMLCWWEVKSWGEDDLTWVGWLWPWWHRVGQGRNEWGRRGLFPVDTALDKPGRRSQCRCSEEQAVDMSSRVRKGTWLVLWVKLQLWYMTACEKLHGISFSYNSQIVKECHQTPASVCTPSARRRGLRGGPSSRFAFHSWFSRVPAGPFNLVTTVYCSVLFWWESPRLTVTQRELVAGKGFTGWPAQRDCLFPGRWAVQGGGWGAGSGAGQIDVLILFTLMGEVSLDKLLNL